jgi:prepilin-type processing-associated H-X9-DG protein
VKRIEVPVFLCPSNYSSGANQNFPSHYVGVTGAGRDNQFVDLEDEVCGNQYIDGLLYPRSETTPAHVKDGQSTTLMIGERIFSSDRSSWAEGAYWSQSPKRQICMSSTKNVRWPINCPFEVCGYPRGADGAPDNAKRLLQNDTMFSSFHSGGAQFVFIDGHVELKTDDTDLECLQHLATIRGREVLCSE